MQLITAPCAPVEFAGRIPDRNYFRLQKGDSPLRRAGLRSGDIYVGLDGEAVTIETAQKRIRALGSQKEGTLHLTVERDGRPLELVLDASSVDENESLEISFEPVLE
jgi:predicted metalloprotease with PDZ domain